MSQDLLAAKNVDDDVAGAGISIDQRVQGAEKVFGPKHDYASCAKTNSGEAVVDRTNTSSNLGPCDPAS